jgi:hypothetical protein
MVPGRFPELNLPTKLFPFLEWSGIESTITEATYPQNKNYLKKMKLKLKIKLKMMTNLFSVFDPSTRFINVSIN